MRIEITSRATFSPANVNRIFRAAKDSVSGFFRVCDDLDEVHLLAFRAMFGADSQRLIKTTTKTPDMGHDPKGVPVVVFLEGKQGLSCLMTVPGLGDEQVLALIKNGPYLRKKKAEKALPAPADSEVAPQRNEAPASVSLEAVAEPSVPVAAEQPAVSTKPVPPQPSPRRQTPLEKLEANGVEPAEIERLKATVASIVYRKVGDGEVPNSLLVPVEEITSAILEHMGLPMNSTGTYRGIIGNFYQSRITLFALKWENSSSEDAQYTDWLFDCNIVLDFVGGKNNLAALTIARDTEVRERVAKEEAAEQNPPPKADEVAKAAGFLADASLLELAAQTLEGKRKAEEEARLAETNAAKILEEIGALEARLEETKAAHRTASSLLDAARARVSEYVLSPEAMSKIRAAKARIDALVEGLGI